MKITGKPAKDLMDIFFTDPSEIPLPPVEVRIRGLRAEPWGDGRRVRVYFEVDPFQKRPNAEVRITNARQEELASISVIETMVRKMEFTLHLRGAELLPPYSLSAELFYALPEEGQSDSDASGAGETGADALVERPRPGIQVVDRADVQFNLAT